MLESTYDYFRGGFQLIILYLLAQDLMSMIRTRQILRNAIISPELISLDFEIRCSNGSIRIVLAMDLMAKRGDFQIFARSSLVSVPIGVLLAHFSIVVAFLCIPFLAMGSLNYRLNFDAVLMAITPIIQIFQDLMIQQTSRSSD